ncbi:sulfite reductase subunit alpha [Brevundimonas sp.]|uniref:sulfite reductase subunit alpha n=1 Tax=Brevundimonas sp. TaxID=1871086 RepID=UPI00286D6748|nr:sulfite reductase subunit alpha [Brevundimonas sp.]
MSDGSVRWLWAALTVVAWLVFTGWTVWRFRAKPATAPQPGATLIVVASQTGFGDELAGITRGAFADAGQPVQVKSFADITPADMTAAARVLFIASTTGEGDAPDSASGFVRKVMNDQTDLTGVSYGLLSLGDRTYAEFCGFGRALDGWLRSTGARALFDPVEVDNGDAAAIRHWQVELSRLTGSVAAPDWAPVADTDWRLVERRLLNPGGPGEGAWHLAFEPVDGVLQWVAGDIADIGVPSPEGGLARREYSVASLPADGRAEFLIRRMRRPDGTPGLASGWLTGTLQVGEIAPMRIRANRAFHGPDAATPMILIGNGTGIAGLRSHLKTRAAAPATGGAWLMFGERTSAHDSFHDAELQGWLADGTLTRLDRTFSRDPGDGRYVQAVIEAEADSVRDWVARGAVLYVCGSLEGMAGGVNAALEAVLGVEALRDLVETGRYRRDVY